MSEDLKVRIPADRNRVSFAEPFEVADWIRHFGVSKDRLEEAKHAVGSSPAAIAVFLKH